MAASDVGGVHGAQGKAAQLRPIDVVAARRCHMGGQPADSVYSGTRSNAASKREGELLKLKRTAKPMKVNAMTCMGKQLRVHIG